MMRRFGGPYGCEIMDDGQQDTEDDGIQFGIMSNEEVWKVGRLEGREVGRL